MSVSRVWTTSRKSKNQASGQSIIKYYNYIIYAPRSRIPNRKFWHSTISSLNFETVVRRATCRAISPVLVAPRSKILVRNFQPWCYLMRPAILQIGNFDHGRGIFPWNFGLVVRRVPTMFFLLVLVALRSKIPIRNFGATRCVYLVITPFGRSTVKSSESEILT